MSTRADLLDVVHLPSLYSAETTLLCLVNCTAPTKMPPRDAKRGAEIRRHKLAAHQAALSPEDRIINRTDWEDFTVKQVCLATERSQRHAKAAFIEVAPDPNVGICATSAEAEAFFTTGGIKFTSAVLRKFLEASAVSRSGYIEEERPSKRTIINLAMHLFGSAARSGNPIDREVQRNALLWVEGPLVTKGLVHNKSNVKLTPIPEDITTFLRHLFQPRFMVSLYSTRHILLIALFVCMMVDCSNRTGELLRPSLAPAELAEFMKRTPEKIFTWSHVEVFAFKTKTGDTSLQARIRFEALKNGSRKVIPLRLLPPELVAEDTLFWLMVLGLIDGVFAHVSSWHDIDQMHPGPNGQLIPIRSDMMEVPVSSGRRPFLYLEGICRELIRGYLYIGLSTCAPVGSC